MPISFKKINDHIISMDDFVLKWRFTEEEYNILPEDHLKLINPLDKVGAKFLDKLKSPLHLHIPFTKNYFKTIDSIYFGMDKENEIRKWLYRRGISFNKEVYLSWGVDCGLITTWKIFVKYFDDFFYPGPDDLTIIDKTMNWSILCFHESELFFGTNKKYEIKINNASS